MATNLNKVLEHLHRMFSPLDGGSTDGQLLARFVAARDEAAFAALVRRHGPMVLGVCRRLLRHVQDAEDCFQATFLVLARKASAVKSESVGGWLYAVAYRTSLEARALNARRRRRERQVEDMPHPEVMPAESQDWRSWLDRELNRLPEKYRAAIVACDLEGRSRKEAARLLGLAEGTVSSRLARGRCLLAKQLSRHGLALSGGALAAAMMEGAASAPVSASLLLSTVKTAAGPLTSVSTSVAILTKGVMKTMFLTKLKLAVGAVMIAAALGASGLVYRATAQTGLSQTGPAEKRSDGKPLSEVERLRHENELLKLNLEVVLEKVRAQEAELRALRADAKHKAEKAPQRDDLRFWTERAAWSQRMSHPDRQYVTPAQAEADRARLRAARFAAAEAALKALRDARDSESRRHAADNLDKILKELREPAKQPDSGKK